jgi:hypothetical protein
VVSVSIGGLGGVIFMNKSDEKWKDRIGIKI